MKILTDFRKTVETDLDPRLHVYCFRTRNRSVCKLYKGSTYVQTFMSELIEIQVNFQLVYLLSCLKLYISENTNLEQLLENH